MIRARLALGLLAALAAPLRAQDRVSVEPYARMTVDGPTALAVSPDSRLAAVGGRDGRVTVIDLETRSPVRTLRVGERVRSVVFDGTGAHLVVATEGRRLLTLDVAAGTPLATARLARPPASVDVDRRSGIVVVGGESGDAELFSGDLLPLRRLEAANLYGRDLRYVALGQAGDEVFAAGSGAATAFWSRARGEPLRTGALERAEILAAARDLSGDMLLLAVKTISLLNEGARISANATYSLHLLDWSTGRLAKEIDGLSDPPAAVAIAPVRVVAASVDIEGKLSLWNLQQEQEVATARMDRDAIALEFSADGRWLLAAARGGEVICWRVQGVGSTRPLARVSDTEGLISRPKFEFTTETTPVLDRSTPGSLAVLGLDNLGVDATLARTVDNLLTARLADYPGLRLVERAAIDRVVREVRLQNEGLTSVRDAARIGAMLNARHVLVGSLNQLGSTLVVSVRLVETESARIEGAREITCNDCAAEDLPRALTLLVEALAGPH